MSDGPFNINPGIGECLPQPKIKQVTPEQLKQYEELKQTKALIAEKKALNCKRKWRWNFTFCPCPICADHNRVKEKISGKEYFKIPFTNLRIPRFDLIIDQTKSFQSNLRPGQACGGCGGSRKLPNPSDDSEKYQKIAQKLKDKSELILERESKLGAGGHRTTVVQGCETLVVGLGFNSNKSYKIVQDQAIAPRMAGTKIPQMNAQKTNAVKGVQHQIGWPQAVGNYGIKCANKFDLLVGAGGIEMNTGGPIEINGGQTKITGAEIALGCKEGQLILEGKNVNITGDSISITPTGGQLFLKGSIANTGNMSTQGHTHAESISFVKAAAVGTNKSTKNENASNTNSITHKAVWGPMAGAQAGMDVSNFVQSLLTDIESSAFRVLTPPEMSNLAARIANMMYCMFPYEPIPHAWIYPGTYIGANAGGPVFTGGMVPVYVEPHVHIFPVMQHKHEMLVPDIDVTAGTPNQLRGKTMNGNQDSGIPSDSTSDKARRIETQIKLTAEFAANMAAKMGLTSSKVAAGLA